MRWIAQGSYIQTDSLRFCEVELGMLNLVQRARRKQRTLTIDKRLTTESDNTRVYDLRMSLWVSQHVFMLPPAMLVSYVLLIATKILSKIFRNPVGGMPLPSSEEQKVVVSSIEIPPKLRP